MARLLTVLVLGAAFLAVLFFATWRETAVECEVCVAFAGETACRTVSAADRETALRGAISTACAVLSDGVTQVLACDRTPPRSARCSE